MIPRRLPVGAEPQGARGTHFRVWAPNADRVETLLYENGRIRAAVPLDSEGNGYFSGLVAEARTGSHYRFRLGGGPETWPDPVSRRQPEGPHGPSEVVDPSAFAWTDGTWRGVPRTGQVIYEAHVGTYTPEGTCRALAEQLAELRAAGITVLELMPVAEFPGRFGWGYDGVCLFAPHHLYGTPDDLRALVDRAHAVGLAVILDVVYNHLGPDGNFLARFAKAYFSENEPTEWGDAINFDGPESAPVREFYRANARYWIEEFHFDGFRLDATQSIRDSSPVHILREIAEEARGVAEGRSILLVAENEPQDPVLVRDPAQGGYGLDMLWNDDFHHSAVVALTGRNEAYYHDYLGRPQEFISAAKFGFLYQGQWYSWQRDRRGGASFGLSSERFVTFIENHDQVANSACGERLTELTAPASLRAMTAVLLLAPGTPMLFQGQEFGSRRPFHFFADHEPDLAAQVYAGRKEFLRQFASHAAAGDARVPDPADPRTFESSKLDLADRGRHGRIYRLHRDLLQLRRETPAFDPARRTVLDGAVVGDAAFLLRWFAPEGDRLLLVNLGTDLRLDPAPEPLLAPPNGQGWELAWSSEDLDYGGKGTPPVETQENWRLPGRSAVLLRPGPRTELPSVPLAQEDVEQASRGAS